MESSLISLNFFFSPWQTDNMLGANLDLDEFDLNAAM